MELKYTIEQHIAALKELYPSMSPETKAKIKPYLELMRSKKFDDFDEKLLLGDICECIFKEKLYYADNVIIKNGKYEFIPHKN